MNYQLAHEILDKEMDPWWVQCEHEGCDKEFRLPHSLANPFCGAHWAENVF